MLVFYTWTVRTLAETISLMASSEKIGWMATKTPQEGEALYDANTQSGPGAEKNAGKVVVSVNANSRGDGGAPANWPSRGTIEFENVWMKYLPSAPYALKGEYHCCLGLLPHFHSGNCLNSLLQLTASLATDSLW